VVDINLGTGGSGYRVIKALARRQPHQRVVVWTASADTPVRSRCLVLGVDRVFDRATENADFMEYCMAQSEVQFREVGASGRFSATESQPSLQRGAIAASLFGA
jgi:DNA-binding NarL/FixJ family response regulator